MPRAAIKPAKHTEANESDKRKQLLDLIKNMAADGRPVTAAAVVEALYEAQKSGWISPGPRSWLPKESTRHKVILPELHDEKNGRIDARKVALFMGVPLKQLADGLGLNYKAVHRNPSAASFQEALQTVKRSLEILQQFFGPKETIRIWLNTPHPDLNGATALATILEGKAFAVDRILSNAWNGVPV